jgi:hypothetical protein
MRNMPLTPDGAKEAVELIPVFIQAATQFVMAAGAAFRHPDATFVAILVPNSTAGNNDVPVS